MARRRAQRVSALATKTPSRVERDFSAPAFDSAFVMALVTNITVASLLFGGIKFLPQECAETLLIETNSLFSITANMTLQLRKGSGVLTSVRLPGSDS